jgi:hypothetical protein
MQTGNWLEELEPRTHLSATLSHRGVLYVYGTHGNDVINVCLQARHRSFVVVNVNGQVSAFKASAVRYLIVQGGRGNDRITISDRNGHVGGKHSLFGGAGTDYICGDSTSDYIVGGDDYEDDIIAGGDGIPVPSDPTPAPSGGNSDSGSDPGNSSSGDNGSSNDNSGGDPGNSGSPPSDDSSTGGDVGDSGNTSTDDSSTGGDFGDSGDTGSDDSSTGSDFVARVAARNVFQSNRNI